MVGVSFVKGVCGHLLQPWKKICKQWVLCIVKLPIVDCDISTATVLIWGSSITIHYIRYLAQQLAAFHVFDPLTSKIWEKIITTSRIAKIFQTRGSHIVTPRLSTRLSCWHPQNAAKLWFIFQISTLDPHGINERFPLHKFILVFSSSYSRQ